MSKTTSPANTNKNHDEGKCRVDDERAHINTAFTK